jgi:hypothetical protein
MYREDVVNILRNELATTQHALQETNKQVVRLHAEKTHIVQMSEKAIKQCDQEIRSLHNIIDSMAEKMRWLILEMGSGKIVAQEALNRLNEIIPVRVGEAHEKDSSRST